MAVEVDCLSRCTTTRAFGRPLGRELRNGTTVGWFGAYCSLPSLLLTSPCGGCSKMCCSCTGIPSFGSVSTNNHAGWHTRRICWIGSEGIHSKWAGPDAVFRFFSQEGVRVGETQNCGNRIGKQRVCLRPMRKADGGKCDGGSVVHHDPTGISDRSNRLDTVRAISLLVVGMFSRLRLRETFRNLCWEHFTAWLFCSWPS